MEDTFRMVVFEEEMQEAACETPRKRGADERSSQRSRCTYGKNVAHSLGVETQWMRWNISLR